MSSLTRMVCSTPTSGSNVILLDTHVLLWIHLHDGRLGRRARQLIDRAWENGEAGVSTITFWEVGMLQGKGRIGVTGELFSWRSGLLDAGLVEIPVTGEIGTQAGVLTNMHGDPADRVIAATAITLPDCQLLTADERLLDWPGRLDRFDARI